MPRPGPVKPAIALRLDAALLASIDAAAEAAGVTRSDMIRGFIEVGLGKA